MSIKKQAGWEWQFHIQEGPYAGNFVSRAAKKKVSWPLWEKSHHYILAEQCKGKRLTDGEIEGPGSFGKLLEELVDKYYDVRVAVSKDAKWNNIGLILGPSKDQKEVTRKGQTTLEDDSLPEGL